MTHTNDVKHTFYLVILLLSHNVKKITFRKTDSVCPFRCPSEASRSAGGIFRLEKRIPYEILREFDGSCPNIWI